MDNTKSVLNDTTIELRQMRHDAMVERYLLDGRKKELFSRMIALTSSYNKLIEAYTKNVIDYQARNFRIAVCQEQLSRCTKTINKLLFDSISSNYAGTPVEFIPNKFKKAKVEELEESVVYEQPSIFTQLDITNRRARPY